ncbi:MAG: TerB family tellurite resistance protein [Armatimonadetes bacterium]|nr:TerB family tellurite resistance protein [Armatimonadota bacterium]
MANQHLIDYNEADRADYMAVVASLAGADGDVSSEEIFALRELCKHFLLGPDARGRVMAATTPGAENLDEALARLAKTDLKDSLVLDVCAMAWRDGKLVEAEEAEIRRLAGRLSVPNGHVEALMKLAEAIQKGAHPADALPALEAAGVPRASVAVSATLYGMSKAGNEGAKEALGAAI